MLIRHTTIFLIILSCFTLQSQDKLGLANKYFNDYAYYKALNLYKEVVKLGDSSRQVLERIGDCYYNNSQTQESEKWYSKAIKGKSKPELKLLYKYIQSLKSQTKYKEAYQWLIKYKALKKERVETDDKDYVRLFKDLSTPKNKLTKLINLSINTKYSDFGGYFYKDTLYYSSSKVGNNVIKPKDIYQWNNQPYLNLYAVKVDFKESHIETGTDKNLEELNTKVHEATAIITKDGNTMYFTCDNLRNSKKLRPDEEGTVHLQLYKAQKKNGKWKNLQLLPFNTINYSFGHPALSQDEKTLYFVSDMPGGLGETDLYKVKINEDKSYGVPENLGPKINTEGREMFPFIDDNDNLFFSSDGYVNLGLLDIYRSNYLQVNDSEEIININLGAPYNSGFDDFSFYKMIDNDQGVLSSDRPNGEGSDDVYGFLNIHCEQRIHGVVTNKQTHEPLVLTTVRLLDDEGRIVDTVKSDLEGVYKFLQVECDKLFLVVGTKEDYKSHKKEIKTTLDNKADILANLELTPLIINNEIVINPIFFDFDKSNIRIDAAYELENIVNVLKAHKNMVIKIESHTDSRGRDKYNLKLSKRRAESTKNYLLSRGIPEHQIQSAKGYGESQLLNRCFNGVKCSKIEHQLNRRSKFIIVN